MEQFNSTILFSALTEAILFKSSHLAVEKKKKKMEEVKTAAMINRPLVHPHSGG